MKKYIAAAAVLIAILCSISVYAVEIDSLLVTDTSHSIVTVKGSVGEGMNNRLVTLTLTDANKPEVLRQVDVVEVGSDGVFEYSFAFRGATGLYRVTALCGAERTTKDLSYTSTEDVKRFLSDLVDNKVTDIYASLKEYSSSLGVDLAAFQNQTQQNVLVKRIKEGYPVIKNALGKGDLDEVARIAQKAAREVELLQKIEKSVLWTSIYGILADTTDITGISFQTYNQLSANGKQQVDSSLVGGVFRDADELREFFDRQAALRKAAEDKPSSGGTGSGASGGGGRGGGSGGVLLSDISNHEADRVIPDHEQVGFHDVAADYWAYQEIEALSEKGVIAGNGDGSFAPEGTITREEFAKMAVLAFEYFQEGATAEFADVQPDAWYYPYVASANASGIMNGVSAEIFGQGERLTREDMTVILYRIAKQKNVAFTAEDTSFADFAEISDYAQEAVGFMAGSKMVQGMDGQHFRPKENATRAQAARLIYVLLQEV